MGGAHTKGPWVLSGPVLGGFIIERPDGSGFFVNGDPSEARLAAAAPDLLAALVKLRAEYESIVRSEYEGRRGMPGWFPEVVADADAAIARATGAE